MASNLYFVLANPKDGREAEFNEWYDNVHLKDVVAQQGITSAQRYLLTVPEVAKGYPQPSHRYMAVYEYEGDPNDVVAGMRAALASGEMQIHDSLDRENITMIFWQPQGPRLESA